MQKRTKRGHNFRQITSAYPDLAENEDLKTAANALDELQDLSTLAESEGGKILIKKLTDKAAGYLRMTIQMSKTEHSHESLLGVIARLDATMDLIAELNLSIYNTDSQQEVVDQIIEAAQ